MPERCIWKYPIPCNITPNAIGYKEEFVLSMPKGSRILSVQLIGNTPTIWAICDPMVELAERQFLMMETGKSIPEAWEAKILNGDAQFVGTFVPNNKRGLAFHLFYHI